MPLSDEQKAKWNKIFEEEKDLLNNHPFMTGENGNKKIDREACLAYLNSLAEAEFMLRTKQQAVVWCLEDSIKNESESEKKRIREFDKTHKFKSGLEIEKEKAEKKAAGTVVSKEEKLILSVMARLNYTRDQAVAWINEDV